ncbi:MAG: class I SAM-dependent DNA methyltransferase [Bradymonadia bacterium]
MSEDNSWDAYAEGWDEDPGARSYAEQAYALLSELLTSLGRSLDGARVLDFGCGTGLLSEKLAPAQVLALDGSLAMIEVLRAKGLPHVDARVGTVPADGVLPEEISGPYGLIVASSVCAFLGKGYPGVLRTLAGALQPGGLFVQWDWAWTGGDDPYGLTSQEISEALDGADLERVRLEPAFTMETPKGEAEVMWAVGRRPEVT